MALELGRSWNIEKKRGRGDTYTTSALRDMARGHPKSSLRECDSEKERDDTYMTSALGGVWQGGTPKAVYVSVTEG